MSIFLRTVSRLGGDSSPRVFYATETQTRIIKGNEVSKSKKASTIKTLHRENKEMFGELLESKRDKVLKEKKSVIKAISDESSQETVFVAIQTQNQGPKTSRHIVNQSQIVPRSFFQIDATVNIAKHGDPNGEKKLTKTTEGSWMAKTSSRYTKLFSRIKPVGDENTSCATGVIDPISPSYMESTKSLSTTSSTLHELSKKEMSPKELREVPTVKQLLTSIHQCKEINVNTEVKRIRKDGTIVDAKADETNLLVSDKTIEGQEVTSERQEISRKNTTSSYDDLRSSLSNLHPFHRIDHEDMISAGYKLFPLDNPGRQTTEDKNLINVLPEQILSLAYPPVENYKAQTEPKYRFASVTRILAATIPAQQAKVLKLWEERMIRELGVDGFRKYKEELFSSGKLLHKNIQSILSGKSIEDLQISPAIEGHWKSLQGVLGHMKNTAVLESYVSHPELCYSGIVDCVATYKDKLVLIDWKTSEKPKPFISNTYDTPLQIAAYIGAFNYDPSYKMKVLEGLAVIAYKDGRDCQVFHLDSGNLLKYWKLWLQRLKLYYAREA